jgi:hypothetical protein
MMKFFTFALVVLGGNLSTIALAWQSISTPVETGCPQISETVFRNVQALPVHVTASQSNKELLAISDSIQKTAVTLGKTTPSYFIKSQFDFAARDAARFIKSHQKTKVTTENREELQFTATNLSRSVVLCYY